MSQSSQLISIVESSEYKLYAILQGNVLNFKLTIKIGSNISDEIYEAKINLIQDTHSFQDVKEILSYVKQPENIFVNLNQLSLAILSKEFGETIEITKIFFLLQQNTKTKKVQVSTIIQRCLKIDYLQNQEVKSFLYNLALNIEQFARNKNFFQNMDKIFEDIQSVKNQIKQNNKKTQKIKKIFLCEQQGLCLCHPLPIYINHQKLIDSIEQQFQFKEQYRKMKLNNQFMLIIQKQISKIKEEIFEVKSFLNKGDVNPANQKLSPTSQQTQCQKKSKIITNNQQNLLKSLHERYSEITGNILAIPQLCLSAQFVESQQIFLNPNKVMASEWVDQQCRDFKNLQIQGNKITAQKCSYIFGKLKLDSKCQFTIKAQNILKWMGVGVADTQYKYLDDLSQITNRLCYCSDRQCRIGLQDKLNQGSGFKKGDKVTIFVDLVLGRIQWKVDNQVRNSASYNLLKNKNISWVPFIILWDKYDSVSLVHEQ